MVYGHGGRFLGLISVNKSYNCDEQKTFISTVNKSSAIYSHGHHDLLTT